MNVKFFMLTAACAAIFMAGPIAAAQKSKPMQTFGYLENVHVTPDDLAMKAKLDTGADNSSINARILKQTKVKGENWIEFDVINRQGKKQRLRKKLVRTAVIKRAGGTKQARPVVNMVICLGTVEREVEVNLVNRKDLNYKLLLGRSFLKGVALVDSGKTYLHEPVCQ